MFLFDRSKHDDHYTDNVFVDYSFVAAEQFWKIFFLWVIGKKSNFILYIHVALTGWQLLHDSSCELVSFFSPLELELSAEIDC